MAFSGSFAAVQLRVALVIVAFVTETVKDWGAWLGGGASLPLLLQDITIMETRKRT